jgi:hypothetical protein
MWRDTSPGHQTYANTQTHTVLCDAIPVPVTKRTQTHKHTLYFLINYNNDWDVVFENKVRTFIDIS